MSDTVAKLKKGEQATPEQMQALLAEFKAKLGPEVEQQLLRGGEEGLTERTLTRWLVARKLDIAKAVKDLTEHASWRASFVPTGLIPEEDVKVEVEQDKSFLGTQTGCDKEGHPTLIAKVCRHKIAKDSKDFYKFMVYTLDAGILCGLTEEKRSGVAWDGKLVGILDLSNITLSNCDTSGLMIIFDLLQNHYVERLHRMYLYCAPTIFNAVWSVVAPFVDPVTRKKVQFVSAKDAAALFASDYEPGVLPNWLGGEGTDYPLSLARRELLLKYKQYQQDQQQNEQEVVTQQQEQQGDELAKEVTVMALAQEVAA